MPMPRPARSNRLLALALLVAASLAVGSCTQQQVRLNPTRSTARDPGGLQGTRVPAAKRIVAIGDIHGDLAPLIKVLRMARLIDRKQRWIGGDTTLVQVGDILDRGDDEVAIFELFRRLRLEAAKAGGRVITLLGNHEIMNALGDFRYVTPGGYNDFENTPGLSLPRKRGEVPAIDAARRAAFKPGGPWARRIARFGVIVLVGDNVFVHGGLREHHAKYGFTRINRDVRMWLLGDRKFPVYMGRPTSPVWMRLYADKDNEAMCRKLDKALKSAGAKRMIIGHTPQLKGISAGCGGKVWRIDSGMCRHYGGKASAIEIRGDKVRVIDTFQPVTAPVAKAE